MHALFQDGSDLPLWALYNPAPEPKQHRPDLGYTQPNMFEGEDNAEDRTQDDERTLPLAGEDNRDD